MRDLAQQLFSDAALATDPIARELIVVLSSKTGRTKSGHPFLQEPAWTRFRDWVPHILDDGERVLAAKDRVVVRIRALAPTPDAMTHVEQAAKVVEQIVRTAAITAPADLWLLRHVLAAFSRTGLSKRLLSGDTLKLSESDFVDDELKVDLRFLLSRRLLRLFGGGFRLAENDAAAAAFSHEFLVDKRWPSSLAAAFTDAIRGTADDDVRASLIDLAHAPLPPSARAPGFFTPSPREIEIGFRLVPVVLALRASGKVTDVLAAGNMKSVSGRGDIDDAMRAICRDAGVIDDDHALTSVGARVLERGPGPFGIIETYHAYLTRLDEILKDGRAKVWVERSANVAASQDANRASFERANAALDRFCDDTKYPLKVFVEHALGRGEATRQRFERAGTTLSFVGADLEDAAIDAALEEQASGALPSSMVFVRNADIGQPDTLLSVMKENHVDPRGAVMVVGNGFHEVRDQTDDRMTAVFRRYADAGIILLFTEETGLAVTDLLETAWNTYHAGFKYVHERSGQGLRPAEYRPPSALDVGFPLSWVECAERAGYRRLDAYSPRGRTVYPYTPLSGVNPAITVTHFCVPVALVDDGTIRLPS